MTESHRKPGLQGPAYMSGSLPTSCSAGCALPWPAAQTPKYGITVNIDDKKADFAAIKKYAWQRGQASFDKAIDASIVAAVDDELAKLGMVKDAPESAQVLVTYASTNRTDVDLKGKARSGRRASELSGRHAGGRIPGRQDAQPPAAAAGRPADRRGP